MGTSTCFLVFLLFTCVVESYKLLALMNVPSHSHHKWNIVYLKELAERGHEITYVTVDEWDKPPANIRHVLLEDAYLMYNDLNFSAMADQNAYQTMMGLNELYDITSRDQLKSKGMQRLVDIVRNEKFDGVIFDSAGCPFLLGAVDVLGNPPVVGITAFGVPHWTMDMSATPYPIANSPYFTYPLGRNLNFFNRLENAAFFAFSYLHRKFFLYPAQDQYSKEVFGRDVRNVEEIQNSISVNLVNANWATENTFPLSPGLIPIGGLHIAEPKPLPKDLRNFLDTSQNGVVFFSLGSNVPSSLLPPEVIENILVAFRRLAPLRIIWKWENDVLPGQPENVMIGKWLPQNDILAHPKCRLFITHGGMLSSQEAVHHGVPVLGIPFLVDQHVNVRRAAENGMGEFIMLRDITPDLVYDVINNIVTNPKYKETATRLSKLFRDDLNPPLARAVFWTEYALRHDGAHHLKPPSSKLSWFQSGHYDIILAALGILYLIYYLMDSVLSSIFGSSKPRPKQKRH